MFWLEIAGVSVGVAFVGYLILTIEWRDRQMRALIIATQAALDRLKAIEEHIERFADTVEKIERHTRRVAKPLYDQDQWDRENPSF